MYRYVIIIIIIVYIVMLLQKRNIRKLRSFEGLESCNRKHTIVYRVKFVTLVILCTKICVWSNAARYYVRWLSSKSANFHNSSKYIYIYISCTHFWKFIEILILTILISSTLFLSLVMCTKLLLELLMEFFPLLMVSFVIRFTVPLCLTHEGCISLIFNIHCQWTRSNFHRLLF